MLSYTRNLYMNFILLSFSELNICSIEILYKYSSELKIAFYRVFLQYSKEKVNLLQNFFIELLLG